MVSHAIRTGVTIIISTTTPPIRVVPHVLLEGQTPLREGVITTTPPIRGQAGIGAPVRGGSCTWRWWRAWSVVPHALLEGVTAEAHPTETLFRTADSRGFTGPNATTHRAARRARWRGGGWFQHSPTLSRTTRSRGFAGQNATTQQGGESGSCVAGASSRGGER